MTLPPPSTSDTKACPYCGEQIKAIAKRCRFCSEFLDDELRRESLRHNTPDAAERFIAPVGRTPASIVAGYLGLFSLIPFVGVFAIGLSLVALKELKDRPEKSGRGRAIFGLAMGSICTVFYGFMLLLAAVN